MSELDMTTPNWKQQEQWVSRVVEYSSQFNQTSRSASKVIGPPRVYPRHGNVIGGWVQRNRKEGDYIIVEFERAVRPEQIDIYEILNPGSVVKVSVRNGRDNTEWEIVWETNVLFHLENCSRIFSVACTNIAATDINQVRLDIRCDESSTGFGIDCINLIGHTSHLTSSRQEILTNLKELLTDDCLADVTFELDNGQLISSHRNILSIRSIYFADLFHDYPLNRKEPIRIKNISYEAFYQIVQFIFTDTIDSTITYEICLELMRKADEYFLNSIYTKAFDILKTMINSTSVLEIATQSGLFPATSNDNEQDRIVLDDAINLCVDFIRKNRRDVYCYENIQRLTKDMLIVLIELGM